MYVNIIFMQGDEGRAVTDALEHCQGITAYGATAPSIEAVIDYLAQWDQGDTAYHDLTDEPRAGSGDRTARVDGYVLSWNLGLGYVGLEAEVTEDGGHADVSTCRGCEQPIDYCTDHTHAPDMDSDDWRDDYDRTMSVIERGMPQ